jgi:SAM-dependent methyltransferase
MKSKTHSDMQESEIIKQQVKDKYNQLARAKQDCCATEDCSFIGESYSTLDGYVSDADLGLGCGLPTQFAGIRRGDTVVDLGSGAGNDAFIARRETGAEGRVIGIDMAEDMIARAGQNLSKLGFSNVEFRLGDIEDIPLADNVADVVVSNCVLNLVPDKNRAYAETFRILKPGGHFSISDVVITGVLPPSLQRAAELYAGCVAGAMDKEAYLNTIRDTGFEGLTIQKEREIELSEELLDTYLDAEQKALLQTSGIGIYSITVWAKKPDKGCC